MDQPVRRREILPSDIERYRRMTVEERLDLGFRLFEMGRMLAGDLEERRKAVAHLRA